MSDKPTTLFLKWQTWIKGENVVLYFEDSMHGDDVWIELRPDGVVLVKRSGDDDDFENPDKDATITPIPDLRTFLMKRLTP